MAARINSRRHILSDSDPQASYLLETTTMDDLENISSAFMNTTEAPHAARNENLAKAEVGVLAAIMFFAIFGNCIVLLVLFLRKKKLSRMNLLIVHLSIADLFVALFEVLPQLVWDITYRFMGNDFLCRTVKFMQLVAMYASSFVLVTTAIDRYIAIVHPLTSHTWTTRRVHLLVGVAWALSLLFAMPQLFLFAMREVAPGTGQYDCWENLNLEWEMPAYITWITLSIYVIPFFILVFAYGRICFVVWRSVQFKECSQRKAKITYTGNERSSAPENGKLLNGDTLKDPNARKQTCSNPRAHVRGLSNAKLKTVKMTMTVIICYLVCWTPFFVAQLWSAWDANAPFRGRLTLKY